MDLLDKQEKTRDSKGRLLPGHTANPHGRPKRKTLTELIHEKLDKDPNGWKDLVETILLMAKRKDRDIIKELWHYTDGMPSQKTDITSGGEPIAILGGLSKDVPTDTSNSQDSKTD